MNFMNGLKQPGLFICGSMTFFSRKKILFYDDSLKQETHWSMSHFPQWKPAKDGKKDWLQESHAKANCVDNL